VISCAGTAAFKPFADLTDADYELGLRSKLIGQVSLARVAKDHLRDGGSITLTTGLLAMHPMPGSASVSMVNAGLEGFVRAAALEMYYEENEDPVVGTFDLTPFVLAFFVFFAALFSAFIAIFSSLPRLTTMRTSESLSAPILSQFSIVLRSRSGSLAMLAAMRRACEAESFYRPNTEYLARLDIQPIDRFGGSLPNHLQLGVVVALAHPKYGNRRFLFWKGHKIEFPRGRLPDLLGTLKGPDFPSGWHQDEYAPKGRGRKGILWLWRRRDVIVPR
jgi:Enoyl-(Acyl carrier protein) reductase